MKNVIDKNKCTGCTACKNICPKNCITMEYNEEGFLYPNIDETKCLKCGLCEKTCPVLKKHFSKKIPKTKITYTKNVEGRMTSSSGGIFEELAKAFISEKGIVCGARYNKNNVTHEIITKEKEITNLKGSKYVQSELGDSFKNIKKYLDENTKVLFVGTACQIAGLYAFLKKDYANLYTCDVLCHGVPSPKVFEKYEEYLEKKYNSKIKTYEFRNKDDGWNNYYTKVTFGNDRVYKCRFYDDLYMKGFLQNLYLRPSCGECHFKNKTHISDITLGDYWGVTKYYKEMNDGKGLSVVFLNTSKGEKLFDTIKDNLEYKDCTFEEAICNNEILFTSVKHSNNREQFFRDFKEKDINIAINNNIMHDPLWKKTIKSILKVIGLRK